VKGALVASSGAPVALVREPSDRLVDAELTHLPRRPIDLERARAQHAGYVELLSRLGVTPQWLPPLPAHADGVFVEDTVIIVDDAAVLMRPGAVSRRGEVDSVAAVLHARGYELLRIVGPGTADGGDVLQVGRTLYVGRTARTNAAAIEQLRGLVAPLGREVVAVPVTDVLHLKTAATALPDGTIVAVPGCVAGDAFGQREVLSAPEPAGGDLLVVGEVVVVSAAAPRTAELIHGRGFPVELVEVSELEKAEAGVTCMSVLLGLPVPGAD
jgi:dimethylargininase